MILSNKISKRNKNVTNRKNTANENSILIVALVHFVKLTNTLITHTAQNISATLQQHLNILTTTL